MKMVFSKHALMKMRERRITKTKVKETITEPDITGFSYNMRVESYKLFGKLYLKVLTVTEGESVIVVTTHWVERVKHK